MRTGFCLLILFVSCAPTPVGHISPTLAANRINVGFLIMDGVYNTELTAPFDIFHHTIFRDSIQPMNVFMVAKTMDVVTSFEGIRLLPDFSYRDAHLPKIDILVIPSAEHHMDTDLHDTEMLDFVRRTAAKARFVTSHCDGSFVLAKAGVLDGIESTTFPTDIDPYRKMFPHLTVHDSVMFVHHGKFITSAGGARSFDAALYLAQLLYGKTVADKLAAGLVIDWDLTEVPHIVVKTCSVNQ